MFIKYASIFFLLVFTVAFTQNQLPAKDSTTYKRTLAACKTWEDTIRHLRANAMVNIELIKLRNDSTATKRDTVLIIDTTNKKLP